MLLAPTPPPLAFMGLSYKRVTSQPQKGSEKGVKMLPSSRWNFLQRLRPHKNNTVRSEIYFIEKDNRLL